MRNYTVVFSFLIPFISAVAISILSFRPFLCICIFYFSYSTNLSIIFSILSSCSPRHTSPVLLCLVPRCLVPYFRFFYPYMVFFLSFLYFSTPCFERRLIILCSLFQCVQDQSIVVLHSRRRERLHMQSTGRRRDDEMQRTSAFRVRR